MARATGHPEVGRIAKAISRPGIDPRTWGVYGVIAEIEVVEDHGVICDVVLMPSGQQETVRVGEPYAGDGWGEHNPLEVDDIVLIEFPNGDPNEVGVVTKRCYSPTATMPQDAVDNPSDVCLTVKPGQNYRLRTSGGGQVVVNSDGDVTITTNGNVTCNAASGQIVQASPKVLLGGPGAAEPFIGGQTFSGAVSGGDITFQTALATLQTAYSTWQGTPPAPPAPWISATVLFLEALNTFCVAAAANSSAVDAGLTSALSTVVTGDLIPEGGG